MASLIRFVFQEEVSYDLPFNISMREAMATLSIIIIHWIDMQLKAQLSKEDALKSLPTPSITNDGYPRAFWWFQRQPNLKKSWWFQRLQIPKNCGDFNACTLFENYSKCRIWISQFWHFPPMFVILKLTCLVTLFDGKLQVFKMEHFGHF